MGRAQSRAVWSSTMAIQTSRLEPSECPGPSTCSWRTWGGLASIRKVFSVLWAAWEGVEACPDLIPGTGKGHTLLTGWQVSLSVNSTLPDSDPPTQHTSSAHARAPWDAR
jgi:hypothetical protein